ncbi:MAG: PASTA domain-containing protein [Verrucomicrobia bacterium]|nr:PASTA domain-containing protein [Verrucomicrobiota bacterium]
MSRHKAEWKVGGRLLVLFALVLGFLSPAVHQQVFAASQYDVTVTVYGDGGKPLKDATVTGYRTSTRYYSVQTDSNGQATVRAELGSVTITAAGYKDAKVQVTGPTLDVRMAPFKSDAGWLAEWLKKWFGKGVDASVGGLRGIKVLVHGKDKAGAVKPIAGASVSTPGVAGEITDADGRTTLNTSASAGETVPVSVWAKGYAFQSKSVTLEMIGSWQFGKPAGMAAVTFMLEPSDSGPAPDVVTLIVQVYDAADPKPIAGAGVKLELCKPPEGANLSKSSDTTGGKGEATFTSHNTANLPASQLFAGGLRAKVTHPDYVETMRDISAEFLLNANQPRFFSVPLTRKAAPPPPLPPMPACLGDLRGHLKKAADEKADADTARKAMDAALRSVLAAAQAASNCKGTFVAAAGLATEMNKAAAIVKAATANDPKAVLAKLQAIEQRAADARNQACKAADLVAKSKPPKAEDVQTAQQYAAIAVAAAAEAEALARPVLDGCKTIRDQLDAQKQLAEKVLQAKKAADDLRALVDAANPDLARAKTSLIFIDSSCPIIRSEHNALANCEATTQQTLGPLLATHPELATRIGEIVAATATVKNLLDTAVQQRDAALSSIAAAETALNNAKAALAALPDFKALTQLSLTISADSRDYLAGGSAVEACLGRIKIIAIKAQECAANASGVSIPPATTDKTTTADSMDSGKLVVPSVVGLTERAASDLLRNKHLTPKSIRMPQAPSSPDLAEVNAQDPSAGMEVASNTVVTIVVAAAGESLPAVTVPNVVTMQAAQAYGQLNSVGLLANSEFLSETAPAGKQNTVKSQQPTAGQQVKPGHVVVLQIHGQVVPSVIGYRLDNANSILAVAKMALNGVVYGDPAPRKGLEDCIFEQTPAPGAAVPANKQLNVKVYGRYTGAPKPPVMTSPSPATPPPLPTAGGGTGFQPGDGARVHPRLAGAQVLDNLPGAEKLGISPACGKGGILSLGKKDPARGPLDNYIFGIVHYASPADAQRLFKISWGKAKKFERKESADDEHECRFPVYQFSDNEYHTQVYFWFKGYKTVKQTTPINSYRTVSYARLYRDSFTIHYSRTIAHPGAVPENPSADLAEIIANSCKLIDLRFPK